MIKLRYCVYCWDLSNDGFSVTEPKLTKSLFATALQTPYPLSVSNPSSSLFSPTYLLISPVWTSACVIWRIHIVSQTPMMNHVNVTLKLRGIIESDTEKSPRNWWHFCQMEGTLCVCVCVQSMFFFLLPLLLYSSGSLNSLSHFLSASCLNSPLSFILHLSPSLLNSSCVVLEYPSCWLCDYRFVMKSSNSCSCQHKSWRTNI